MATPVFGPLMIYNVSLAVLDALLLKRLSKVEPGAVWLAYLIPWSFVIVALAGLLGRDRFMMLSLLACGIFVHGPAMLSGCALLLRRSARRTAIGLGMLALAVVGVGIDAFLIEPHWLEVTRLELTTSKLTRRLKIVVIADLQTDQITDYEKRVFELAAKERPDLVLLPGDYLHAEADQHPALRKQLRQLIKQAGLSAPLGIHAVRGNVDPPDWAQIFDGLGVTSYRKTASRSFSPLQITGLSLADSFDPHLRVPATDRYQIVVGHGPDFALGDVQADLLIAGHTHGGQVRLPLIGPLMTLSQVPRGWAAGVTALGGGRTLVVSRGIGLERGYAPRLRFLCRPELVVITLVPG